MRTIIIEKCIPKNHQKIIISVIFLWSICKIYRISKFTNNSHHHYYHMIWTQNRSLMLLNSIDIHLNGR
mgnify:CR=1 FL=1